MSIQINPVDFRGFALGAVGTPQLPQVGALGLQAIQSIMSQQDSAANRAAQERMNMARIRSSDEAMLRQNGLERARLDQQNSQFQQSLDMDRNKLALLKSQRLAENAMAAEQMGQEYSLNSQKIDLAVVEQEYKKWKSTQENAQEGLKLEMSQLKDKKAEEIGMMGAFATSARLAMDQVNSPADARAMQLSILDEAARNKYITAEQAKQMGSMPISSFKNALDFKIMQLDKVSEYKSMYDLQHPKEKGNGGMEIVAPDGTVIKMQGLTTPTQTENQKNLITNEKNSTQFDQLEKDYDPAFFTYKNQAGAKLSKEAEKTSDIPVVGAATDLLANTVTGMDKEQRGQFLEKRTKYMNNLEQMFNSYKHEITGAAAGEKEIDMIRKSVLNGEMSPSEAKGALEQIKEKYKAESDLYKKNLGQGLDVSLQPTIRKFNPATGRLE